MHSSFSNLCVHVYLLTAKSFGALWTTSAPFITSSLTFLRQVVLPTRSTALRTLIQSTPRQVSRGPSCLRALPRSLLSAFLLYKIEVHLQFMHHGVPLITNNLNEAHGSIVSEPADSPSTRDGFHARTRHLQTPLWAKSHSHQQYLTYATIASETSSRHDGTRELPQVCSGSRIGGAPTMATNVRNAGPSISLTRSEPHHRGLQVQHCFSFITVLNSTVSAKCSKCVS